MEIITFRNTKDFYILIDFNKIGYRLVYKREGHSFYSKWKNELFLIRAWFGERPYIKPINLKKLNKRALGVLSYSSNQFTYLVQDLINSVGSKHTKEISLDELDEILEFINSFFKMRERIYGKIFLKLEKL